jgi:nucleoside-diphosphate-sugar epimerase
VPGNGRNRISVTHILNFAHAVECVIDKPVTSGVFNIADPEPVCIDDLLNTFLRKNDVEVRLLHIPRNVAWALAEASEWLWRMAGSQKAPRLTRYLVSQVSDGHTLDLDRAYNLLGYTPRHTIDTDFEIGDFA